MKPDKTMRVGNSEQLKLEFSSADMEALPGPLSATMRVLADGKVEVIVRTDSASPYNWGARSEKYGYHPATIRAKALSFLSSGQQPKFTFTPPEDVEWQQDGSVRLLMPTNMAPPRGSRPGKKQRKAASPVFAPPQPAAEPAPPAVPLAGLAKVLAEARQPFALSPVQRAVQQLNHLLAKPGCSVQLRLLPGGGVAAREVLE